MTIPRVGFLFGSDDIRPGNPRYFGIQDVLDLAMASDIQLKLIYDQNMSLTFAMLTPGRTTTSRTTTPRLISDTLNLSITSDITLKLIFDSTMSLTFAESLATPTMESALPAAPSGLIANESVSTPPDVDLDWTDNADNEDNYAVQRAPDSGGSPGNWNNIATGLAANTESYSDTTTTWDTTYWYRVYCYNGRGNSGYSNQVSITTGSEA